MERNRGHKAKEGAQEMGIVSDRCDQCEEVFNWNKALQGTTGVKRKKALKGGGIIGDRYYQEGN